VRFLATVSRRQVRSSRAQRRLVRRLRSAGLVRGRRR
jgi:hypothetical protein